MERSIEAADLWGGRRWEGSGKGKGRRESTSKRRKEGIKTGKWRKGGGRRRKKKGRKTTCMYYLCVFLGGVCSYLKVIQLLVVQNTIIVHVTDLRCVIP